MDVDAPGMYSMTWPTVWESLEEGAIVANGRCFSVAFAQLQLQLLNKSRTLLCLVPAEEACTVRGALNNNRRGSIAFHQGGCQLKWRSLFWSKDMNNEDATTFKHLNGEE